MCIAVDLRRLRPGLVGLALALAVAAAIGARRGAVPGAPPRAVRESPAALPASAPRPSAIYRGPGDRPWVALAVNVDWGDEVLPAMLDLLRREGVRATFFLTGRWARRSPELARRIAREGHEIGNHGLDHLQPSKLTDGQLRALVTQNAALLEQLTGQRPTLFAPPYGEVDERVVELAAAAEHRTVMWTVDTLDWQRPPSEAIVERVAQRLERGAIILIHPTEPTLRALPGLLALLEHRGLFAVPVGELVAALEETPQGRPSGRLPAGTPGP